MSRRREHKIRKKFKRNEHKGKRRMKYDDCGDEGDIEEEVEEEEND